MLGAFTKAWSVPILIDENLVKVVCPVCGTEYVERDPSCPKCGAMGLGSQRVHIKREGRPVPLTGPRPTGAVGARAQPLQPVPRAPVGPVFAQGGYVQQGPYQVRPRLEDPMNTWLGIIGIMIAFGGMMLGIIGTVTYWSICGIVGIVMVVVALVLGAVLVRRGSRMGIALLATGVMMLFMTLLIVGIFWMAGI